MTVMKTAEQFQATYVATLEPKTVSLLKENQDDLRQEFQESNLHCFMLCGKYFRDTVWNGDHAMKIFTFLKRVFKDLKIIINEEYYCQMRRIMIGKL